MTISEKDAFLHKLKEAVVLCCNVKKITAAEIPNDVPIIGGKEGLKLDSLDALEIIVMIEERFGIRLAGDENARALFYSFDKMGTYLLEHAEKTKLDEFMK